MAIGEFLGSLPIARTIVDRFIAGENLEDAIAKAVRLADDGFHVSLAPIDQSSESVTETVEAISRSGLTPTTELSLRLAELGESERERRSAVFHIAEAAEQVGVTLECERDSNEELAIVLDQHKTHPLLGVTLAANRRDTEGQCRRLANTTTRVRLVKGGFQPGSDEGFASKLEVDKAFVRCMKILMSGDGYPMIATHDERMIEIALALATRNTRTQNSYEFDFYLGINAKLAERLLASAETVRLTLPFGEGWYAHAFTRFAARPASLGLVLKGITGR